MVYNKTYTINNLTVANWNANGIKTKRSTLIDFLTRHHVDVACITETHLIPNETFKIPGYLVHRQDREGLIAAGGVSIIIKKQITHHEKQKMELRSLEAIAVDITLQVNKRITIVAAYKQPNNRLHEQDIIQMFNDNQPTLVIGDLNSKNTIWGCRVNNPDGVKLNNLSATHAFQISAPTDYTYYPYRVDHQPDILDIVLIKNFHSSIYQNVITELDSDHIPVLINLCDRPQFNQPIPKLINGIIQWELFTSKLDNNIKSPSNIHTTEDINSALLDYTAAILDSVHQATTPKLLRKPTYYNPLPIEIINLIRYKNRTRRLWQRTRTPQLRALLNSLTHTIKTNLDALRIEAYQQYIQELQPRDNSMWQATNRILKHKSVIPPLKTNNTVHETDQEKCDALANTLEQTFIPSSENVNPQFINEVNIYVANTLTKINGDIQPTSPREIKSIINTLPSRKSPGPDKIPNIVLKNLTRKALAYLATIFNNCLRHGFFPKHWKFSHVLPFHKPGKDKSKPENYRPISLLNTLSKLLEKVIYKRLSEFANRQNIIPNVQFGFRKKHSTNHQLLRITETIEKGFEDKQYTTAAFLDLTRAFDGVWIEGLLYKLAKLETPSYLVKILSSYLADRSFAIRINSTLSSTKSIRAGVPQGSIMGPLLFNIYVHDIPTCPNATIAMFADDTAIISQHRELPIAITQLQQSLDTVCAWFNKWRITINPTKSEAKIFTLKRIDNPVNIVINQTTVAWNTRDSAVKYLGIYFDTKLSWGYHINKKLNQFHTRLALLYPLINKKSSLQIDCTKLIYLAILRPILMYACQIWSNTSKTNIKKLQVQQNKVLRIATKAPWFVRNHQIHTELGIPTIEKYIQHTNKRFFMNINKCSSARDHNLGRKRIHTRLKRKLPQDLVVSSDSSDSESE